MASTSQYQDLGPEAKQYLRNVKSTWKMRLYFLVNLPTLFWWGVRVVEATPAMCKIRIPYGWRSQNPFRSIYFAAQCGAAEISTGLLAILAQKDRPSMAMLVTDVRTTFTKKANQATYFTCEDGAAVFKTVQKAVETGEAQQITMKSIGRMKDGTQVSETHITWSFKVRL